MRRLLAYQLRLSVEKGLPLSRLLIQGIDARSPRRREQKESASPILRRGLEEERGKEGERQGMRERGRRGGRRWGT